MTIRDAAVTPDPLRNPNPSSTSNSMLYGPSVGQFGSPSPSRAPSARARPVSFQRTSVTLQEQLIAEKDAVRDRKEQLAKWIADLEQEERELDTLILGLAGKTTPATNAPTPIRPDSNGGASRSSSRPASRAKSARFASGQALIDVSSLPRGLRNSVSHEQRTPTEQDQRIRAGSMHRSQGVYSYMHDISSFFLGDSLVRCVPHLRLFKEARFINTTSITPELQSLA